MADTHGRTADRPSEIPKAGWWDIVLRMKDAVVECNLDVVSAGIAFNEFFALFPALLAAVSLYGLIADPSTAEHHMSAVAGVLPGEAQSIITDQLRQIAGAGGGKLGLSLAISVLVALWGATRGVKALIEGLNIVYREDEKRGFLALNGAAIALTVAALVFGLVALVLIAGLPAVIDLLPLGGLAKLAVAIARWPLLALFLLAGLAVIYRYAPSRDRPRWRWVSWGAVLAALVWLAGSALFSVYVANFGKYNQSYGSLAAVAVLLLWFQLTSFSVLLGALLDAELEHQTTRDTTTGPERPLGERGAHVADTVGRRRR
ncbi:MAG: YihY/virulence factor BrkB family protein [Actinomycetota bacterium]